jgi:peptide deformylase
MYKILPHDKLPAGIVSAPTDNLLELYKLCLHMENLCLEHNGAGLSAVQVGVPWKLFVVRTPATTKFDHFVNAEYTGLGEKVRSVEGCLSILGTDGQPRQFEVQRWGLIHATGYRLVVDPDLKLLPLDNQFGNLYGIIYQHEADHHSGRLLTEHGREVEVW